MGKSRHRTLAFRESGGTGRRAGLRIPWAKALEGSNPSSRTINPLIDDNCSRPVRRGHPRGRVSRPGRSRDLSGSGGGGARLVPGSLPRTGRPVGRLENPGSHGAAALRLRSAPGPRRQVAGAGRREARAGWRERPKPLPGQHARSRVRRENGEGARPRARCPRRGGQSSGRARPRGVAGCWTRAPPPRSSRISRSLARPTSGLSVSPDRASWSASPTPAWSGVIRRSALSTAAGTAPRRRMPTTGTTRSMKRTP